MKVITISFCLLLLVFGLSALTQAIDFNSTSDLSTYFNPGPDNDFTNISNNGIGDTGCVQVSYLNMGETRVYTMKTGLNINQIDTQYTISAYFYNSSNGGYAGLGFSTANSNISGPACKITSSPAVGMQFYGSGATFYNNLIGLYGGSYSPDIAMPSWFRLQYIITPRGAGLYDAMYVLHRFDNAGNVISLVFSQSTSFTHLTLANGMVYPYFAIDGHRFDYIDNFGVATPNDIELPVTLSSFTATVTSQMLVNLQWITESETNNLGFNIYRSNNSNIENAVKLNSEIINGTNTTTQHNYNFTDPEVENGLTYYYWIESVDFNNDSHFSNYATATVTGANVPIIPQATALKNASPNPFQSNSNTKIGFDVKSGEIATLTIYNMRGQVVQNYTRSEGSHEITWNGRDAQNKACSAGVYLYKLSSPSSYVTKKLILQ